MVPDNEDSIQAIPVETDPLLVVHDHLEGGAVRGDETVEGFGESFDDVPKDKRQLGVTSAVFLVSNRIIGTGIFATPSIILRAAGSVGMALTMWVIGAAVAAAGTAVYLELGTGLPRSGGEKVYLEFIFRKPKYWISCVYAAWAFFMAAAGGGSVVFGEYLLRALDIEPTWVSTRITATLVLTSTLIIHSSFLKWGLRLQNLLGVLGLLNLIFISLCGILVSLGLISLRDGRELPSNFRRVWEGTNWEANAFVTGLFSIIWSYIGYSNANYALSEIKDPIKTIKKAAPLALITITIIYMLVNVAYFVVVDKEEIKNSGQAVTALFFRNVFGGHTERFLCLLIAMSTLGNIMSVVFSQGRVIQELGREGIMPLSSFFASNKPFNAPFAGLFQQTLFSALSVCLPPPGDAYAFVVNFSTYPYTIINSLITIGLLCLRTTWFQGTYNWAPPFSAWKLAAVFFLLSNIFLMIVPFVPPSKGNGPYEHIPYWLHPTATMGVSVFGALYWYIKFKLLPRWFGYKLVRHYTKGEDGVSRATFRKVER